MARRMLPGETASRRLGVRISLARARPRRDARAAGERSDQSPADPAEACRSGLPGAAPSAFGEDLGSSARSTAAAWAAAADAVEASGPPRRCLRQASQRVWAWLLLGLLLAPARAGCGGFASGATEGSSGPQVGACAGTQTKEWSVTSGTDEAEEAQCGALCESEGVAGCCYVRVNTEPPTCRFFAGQGQAYNSKPSRRSTLCTVTP